MKAKTLQIVWHSKDPVFSIDFHPDGYIATGGGDKDIKLWELCCDAEGNPQVRYAASLSGHSRTINCVRFSRTGHCLASAGDSGELLIWRPAPGSSHAAPAAGGIPSTPLSASKGGAIGAAAAAAATAVGTPSTAARDSIVATPARTASQRLADAAADGAGSSVASWKLSSTLRGHHDDVTDLAWSPDDTALMSGSVENEVMMFDVDSRKNLARLAGHRHYVQGVAWDPLGAWMVSQSADRTVRVHGLKPPPTGSKAAANSANIKSSAALAKDVVHAATLSKVSLIAAPQAPAAEAAASSDQAAAAGQQQHQQPGKALQVALFWDESLNSFFRRLAWSPEGSLLAVPAGVFRDHAGQHPRPATYLYARGHWGCPLAALPCPGKPSTAVRFCPLIFKRRSTGSGAGSSGSSGQQAEAAAGDGVGLPYRLVLAVATLDSIMLYDTETLEPFMLVGPLHYAPITDLAWSRNGSCLAVASHDGYCSMVTFQPGELGEVLAEAELPQDLLAALRRTETAAATTAAKSGGGGSHTVAAAGAPMCPVSPAAAGTVAISAAAAGTGLLGSAGKQGQQPQQPQFAKPRSIQPHRIQPQPVSTPTPGNHGTGSSSPFIISSSGKKAGSSSPCVVATGTNRPLTATPSNAVAVANGAAATATPAAVAAPVAAVGGGAAAPPRRRLTPQPVTADGTPVAAASGTQQQQQQQEGSNNGAPGGGVGIVQTRGASEGGSGGSARVGLAAVQAALAAAAKKKAAAKQGAAAADGDGTSAAGGGNNEKGDVAGGSNAAKRVKLG